MNITFTLLCVGRTFLGRGEPGCFHSFDLSFQMWFVRTSTSFVHSDDPSKEFITFPLVPVQQVLCICIPLPLLHLGQCMGYPICYNFAVAKNVVQNVEHGLWHTPASAANSRAVHRRSTSSKDTRSSIVCLSTWGRPKRWLSWMVTLPSRKNFDHRATLRYGKAASPHASRSPSKQVCALRPRANSIFIQELRSCFVNILLGHLNCASTFKDDAQCNSIKHNHHHSLYYFN